MKLKIISFLLTLILYGIMVSAQQRINGKVISAVTKEPLPGAGIKQKNLEISARSGDDGTFVLNLAGTGRIISVSYVGYLSRDIDVSAGHTANMLIELEPLLNTLEEVRVSTGYERVPAGRSTGSFTQISNTVINRTAGTDIINRLRGVTNSLLFDERIPTNQQLSIRGLGTIYGERKPLIVLNNFPYEGDIANINPNDVENITILKDAASASIWGVRAANGVIVITTKNGRLNQPLKVYLNSNVAVTPKPNVFYMPSISSADFIDVEKFLFDKGFYKSLEISTSKPPLTPTVELLIAKRDNRISASQADELINAMTATDVRNDFNRYVYNQGINQQQAVNISGGGDKIAYYFSGGYDRNKDNTGATYNRISLKADNTISVTPKLKLNTGISYLKGGTGTGKLGYGSIYPAPGKSLYPYARLTDEDGKPAILVKDFRRSYADAAESSGLLNWNYVPLMESDYNRTNTSLSDILLNVNGTYSIGNGLSAGLQYQYENSIGNSSTLQDIHSYSARDLINRYTQAGSGGTLSFPVPKGGILDETTDKLFSNAIRTQLNYNKGWSKSLITAIAGAEVRELKQQGNGFRTYGYNESGLTSIPVNYTSTFPQYFNNGSNLLIPTGNSTFSELVNRYTSFYGNGSYVWDDRYIISVSARKDASNLFGVSSNQKGVPLWSAGMAWNLHNEKFFENSWLPYLKLRLSYGYNGNLDKTITAVTTIIYASNNLNNMPYARIRTYPNEELRWERVGTFNAGADFHFKNERISGSLEYYRKKGVDLIGDQPIDPTTGLVKGTIRRNIADMLTRGIDLQLSFRTLEKAFRWQSDVIFNYNQNRLTGYQNSGTAGSTYLNTGIGIIPVLGRPLYGIYTYQWAGLNPLNGDPQGIVEGKVTSDYAAISSKTTLNDLVYHGPALPTVFGSLGNTFSYRNFSLFINITAKLGHYFSRKSISYGNLFNDWNGHSDFAMRWQKPGDESYTDVPSMVYPVNSRRDNFYANSSALVEKADHIRLQDVNLSYQFNNNGRKRVPWSSLELFSNLRNAGIIWRANKQKLDPDYANGYLPSGYTMSFGARMNF